MLKLLLLWRLWVLRQSKTLSVLHSLPLVRFYLFPNKTNWEIQLQSEQAFLLAPKTVCWLHWCLSRIHPRAPGAAPGESCRALPAPIQWSPDTACLSWSWVTATSYILPQGTGLAEPLTLYPHGKSTYSFRRRKEDLHDPQITPGWW